MKHTPGPWKAHYFIRNQRAKTGDWHFTGGEGNRPLLANGERSEANARLIAAAPDLLEALEALADWVHTETHGQHVDLPRANAAIAKVRS